MSHPRNFGDRNSQKAKNIFESGCKVGAGLGAGGLHFGVSAWCRCAGSLRLRTCRNVRCGPLVVCSLLLSAFLLCCRCIGFEYGSISRFKGVFRGFYGVCVGLLGLGALRGLWGFCARVELGG